ncbi:MAG: hypothetical protein NTY00_00955 [Deltaproteobacteria bacterium]|nr:hypothetical protein [Deltaproteobacteria bacterium]
MFPMPVGMNRYEDAFCPRIRNVPHASGDEPPAGANPPGARMMFPTSVGMNRVVDRHAPISTNVPHAPRAGAWIET